MFGITHECDYDAVSVDHETLTFTASNNQNVTAKRNWTHILWGCKCGDVCVESVQGTWTLGDLYRAKEKKQ